MAGRLRDYPIVRDLEAKSPTQQAHAIFVALRELHGVNHSVQKSISHAKIESGLLGLEQLHNLLCWEALRTEYNVELPDVHNFCTDATRSGKTSWFLRWVTDHLIKFQASGQAQEAEFTQFALESLKPVITEMQCMTALEQGNVMSKQLLRAEMERFQELAGLLQRRFNLVHQSLCSNPDSKMGTKETLIAIREMETARGAKVLAVREHSFIMRDKAPVSDSFRIVSTAAMEQLNEWHQGSRSP